MVHDISAQISSVIIKNSISEIRFSMNDIESELEHDVKGEKLRNALKQLEQEGWIKADESSSGEYWKTGPLALQYGDMVKNTESSGGLIPVLPNERES
ncbi:hypothetical protein [Natronorubrum sp. FCH18a]|uniref:hypothetical protein n=1 Tax=Natronorubrum sp. FCH18a TaxID=3447018 RepID=UPI003F516127